MSRPKFAVVREDPDVETRLCEITQARAALVVASGGCTALTLKTRLPGLAVTAFDRSAIQLEHVRRKRAAVAGGDLGALNVGTTDATALNQCGDFEGLFRTLRRFLEEFVATGQDLARFFAPSTTPDGRSALRASWTSSPYWPVAFALAFQDDFLHAMFGPAATQHAERGSYPGYFRRAFERGLARADARTNPFLRHVLAGDYAPGCAPDYALAGRDLDVDLVLGSLTDVPDLGRFDVYSLSNVFDWSDDSLVESWARALRSSSRPGSAIVVRQLNNSRDVRRFFGDAFEFDEALGRSLTEGDRSLFYERIEVAFRR